MAPLNADNITDTIRTNVALVQSPEGQAILRVLEARLAQWPQAVELEANLDRIVPGWKTTEFWMTLLSHAALIGSTLEGALPAKYAAVAAVLVQVAYNLSRGLTKQGSGK